MKRITLVFIVLVSLFSIYSLFTANYNTDILSMLPLEDEVIKEQYRVLSAFGSMEKVVFDISKKDSSVEWDKIVEDAKVIIEEIKRDSLFILNSNVSPESFFELRNSLINNWHFLISNEDSAYISTRLNKDSLENMLDRTLSSLFTFSSSTADPFILKNDPFGFYPVLLKRLAAFSPSKDIRIRDGFLTNEENDRILIIAEFNSSKDEGVAKKRIDELENKLSGENRLIWMGALRASLDNSSSIKRDINVTLPITISIILLICLLIYRNRIYGLITFIPTILSILITFGLFAFFTDFSLILVGFAAALMGITVDFAIHYLYHLDTVTEDQNPLKTVRSPIIASAFTTAGAFLVLYTSKIPALGQLGLITAFGIICAAFLSLFLLPIITNRKENKGIAIFSPAMIFVKFYNSRFSDVLTVPLVVIAIICWFFVSKITFDGDPDNMNGMSKSTLLVERELNKNWSGIGEGAYLTVSSHDFDSLLIKCEEDLVPFINSMNNKKVLQSGKSFTNILPSQNSQNLNIARWNKLFSSENRRIMIDAINLITKRYNLPSESFINYVNSLPRAIKNENKVNLDSYPDFLKDGLLRNSLIFSDSLWIASVPVIAHSDSSWSEIDSLSRKIGIVSVNDDVLGFRIVVLIKEAFIKSAYLIPIVIVLIIFLMLRNFKSVVQVFIPTLFSAGLTLGIMGIFGIKVNIVTMMVFAFIFGLGIDYALLMYYMSKKELAESKDYISHGASSVTVAATTTLAGLGVLVLAKHPVIVTLGTTGVIGILSSYFCAIILVPYLVKKFK